MKNIQAETITIGKNVYISPSATIKGVNGKAKSIVIGDNTFIGDNVQIIVDDFSIGDYCKIHHHSNFHGQRPLIIGHNAWIGQGTIIDCIGGVEIGNNCGIGAYSQLWSHIRYGDPLIGCNYNNYSKLKIGNDVWFVGHCIVSPIIAHDRSMALVGSVITSEMKKGHIYAGTPAKDLTDTIRPQFTEIDIRKKREIMSAFTLHNSIQLIENDNEIKDKNISYFNIIDRTYTKRNTELEIKFMKELQNSLIKFTPNNS